MSDNPKCIVCNQPATCTGNSGPMCDGHCGHDGNGEEGCTLLVYPDVPVEKLQSDVSRALNLAIDAMCRATFDLKGRSCSDLNYAIKECRKVLKEPTP